MQKYLVCETPERAVRVAWLSLPPNGDVSFGMTDKTYIPRRMKASIGIWNAHNRITLDYSLPSEPGARETVYNPHFTFHQPAILQLKGDRDKSRRGENLFEGFCPMWRAVEQQLKVPWIRASTSPLKGIPTSGVARSSYFESENLVINTPFEDLSIRIAIDFLKPANTQPDSASTWHFRAGAVAIAVTATMSYPQIPVLNWSHCF